MWRRMMLARGLPGLQRGVLSEGLREWRTGSTTWLSMSTQKCRRSRADLCKQPESPGSGAHLRRHRVDCCCAVVERDSTADNGPETAVRIYDGRGLIAVALPMSNARTTWPDPWRVGVITKRMLGFTCHDHPQVQHLSCLPSRCAFSIFKKECTL
jgi:hypothetical protein